MAEALAERGRLLTKLAPHLVKAQPFLWPLKQRRHRARLPAVGVGLYDVLAVYAGWPQDRSDPEAPEQAGAKERFTDVRDDALIGAIEFYDARVDDSRMVINLVRSAVRHGARALSRAQVVCFVQDAGGRVGGATVR